MEKRALLAVALSFVVMMLFWYVLPQPKPSKQPVTTSSVENKIAQQVTAPVAPAEKIEHPIAEPPKKAAAAPEKWVFLDSPQLRATFSTLGAGLKAVELKTYHDSAGKNIVLSSQENKFFPLAISSLGKEDLRSVSFQVISQTASSVIFQARTENGLEVTKTITLRPTQYLFDVQVVFRNASSQQLSFADGYDIAVGGILPVKNGYGGISALGVDAIVDHETQHIRYAKVKTERWDSGNVTWAAVKNQFCAFILQGERLAVGFGSWRFAAEEEKEMGLAAALRMGDFALVPGEAKQDKFIFYAGPKEYEVLKGIGNDFVEVMDFGKYLKFFSIWILISLKWIHSWCANYGVAIILLTVVIKLLTLPLTQKSFKSMKEMQAIQPQLGELRVKYKDNPKKLQTEMMALYKEHKINPLGGCLPLLLQMPILIAFFKTLNNAVELRGAPFFGWIKDLSAPDHLFTLPFTLPIIGNSFNLLPLLMVASFVLQQKMSTANKAMAGTAQQQQQQQMMMVLMPIIFGVMFYNMPSGLVIYFTVSTVLGLIQQYYVLKQPAKKVAVVAKS